MKKNGLMWTGFALLTLSLGLMGCEWDDDPSDHDVPPGQGLIVVDNNTGDDVAVYIDGVRQKDADAFEDEPYTVSPGVHRVILDERGGTRSYREDIDAVEGRRTILDVTVRTGDNEYDVAVYFD